MRLTLGLCLCPCLSLGLLAPLACGRSDQNPGFTPDQAQRLDGVITLSDDVATVIGPVNAGDGTIAAQLTTLRDDVNTNSAGVGQLTADVADIQARIQPGGEVATLDEDIVVNDAVAIGFDAAENVQDVRDALRVLNDRLNIIEGQVTTLDTAVDVRIQAAVDQLITDRIAPLELAPRGFILGPSTQTTTGDAGGPAGASAICQTDFAAEPTAHLCTAGEVQHALATAQFNVAGLDAVATWHVPEMTAAYVADAYAGFHYDAAATSLTMSCNNLSHAVAAGAGAEAQGSTLTVDLDFQAAGADVYIVAPAVSCDTVLPLLCCR